MLDWLKTFVDAIAATMPSNAETANWVAAVITACFTLMGMLGTAIAALATLLWKYMQWRENRNLRHENLANVWSKLVTESAEVAKLKEQKAMLEEKLAAAERGSAQAELLERLLARTKDLLRDSRRAHKVALERVGSLEELIGRLATVLDNETNSRLKGFFENGRWSDVDALLAELLNSGRIAPYAQSNALKARLVAVELDGRLPELEGLEADIEDGLTGISYQEREALEKSVQYLLAEDASEALLPYWFGAGGIEELERRVEQSRSTFGSFDARTVKAAIAHVLALLKQGKFSEAMTSYALNVKFAALASKQADARNSQHENDLQYQYSNAWRSLVLGFEGMARSSLEAVLSDDAINLTERQRAKLLCDIAILAAEGGEPEKALEHFNEALPLLENAFSGDDPLKAHYTVAAEDARRYLGRADLHE